MATDVKTYDPAEVLVIVGLFTITGFAPGTFIELAPDEQPWKDDYGVDGEPVRWRPRNPFDTLTLTLAQSSSSNFILSNLLNLDLISEFSVVPVMIQDLNTSGLRSTYVSARGWVHGPSRIVFQGDSPASRKWELRLLGTVYNTKGIDGKDAIRIA